MARVTVEDCIDKVENRFEARHQSGTSPLLGRDEELDLLLRKLLEGDFGAVVKAIGIVFVKQTYCSDDCMCFAT